MCSKQASVLESQVRDKIVQIEYLGKVNGVLLELPDLYIEGGEEHGGEVEACLQHQTDIPHREDRKHQNEGA